VKLRNIRRKQWRRYKQKLDKLWTIPWWRTRQTQQELDRFWREERRLARIAEYERDPGAWWLREAKMAEANFYYHCEAMEKKWGKPNGWYYKQLRQAEIDRKQVAAYYASDYYQRQKARRRASGTE
jgi:hypothetical protein